VIRSLHVLVCSLFVDEALLTSIAFVSVPMTQSRHVLVTGILCSESAVTLVACELVLEGPVMHGIHVLFGCIP